MYVNHKKAKIAFDTLITNESPDWIIISGGERSGKTSFIKEVCPDSKTLFCDPQRSLFYLDGFVSYILAEYQLFAKEFLSHFPSYIEKIKKRYEFDYINDINDDQYNDLVRSLIRIDITEQTYKYANYLGNIISSKFHYIVLDDFYKCDIECYNWLLHFTENYIKSHGYVIALCNFDNPWESTKIYEIFCDIQEFIDIQCFDAEKDYLTVLKNNVYFDNIEELKELSYELFALYKGNAQLLFKTMKLYGTDKFTNDYDRKDRFFRIANNLTLRSVKFNNKIEKLILELLALSPIPLSVSDISKMVEISENIIQEILMNHYNRDLIEMEVLENSDKVGYQISDELINKLLLQNIDIKLRVFY